MRIYFVLGLMGISVLACAQRSYLGVVAGGHLSSSYIEHTLYTLTLNSTVIPGYHGGVMYQYHNEYNPRLKLNTGIQGGLVYSRMGWKQVFELHPSLTTTMDYLMLPLDAIIYTGNENNRIFVLLGVFGDFLLAHQSADPPDPELLLDFEDFYTYSEIRDQAYGYGFNAGIGFQKDFSFGTLQLNGFFNYSLSNFIKNERRADATPDISNLFNGGVSVGYFVQLK